jgi:hypothetical protein
LQGVTEEKLTFSEVAKWFLVRRTKRDKSVCPDEQVRHEVAAPSGGLIQGDRKERNAFRHSERPIIAPNQQLDAPSCHKFVGTSGTTRDTGRGDFGEMKDLQRK